MNRLILPILAILTGLILIALSIRFFQSRRTEVDITHPRGSPINVKLPIKNVFYYPTHREQQMLVKEMLRQINKPN